MNNSEIWIVYFTYSEMSEPVGLQNVNYWNANPCLRLISYNLETSEFYDDEKLISYAGQFDKIHYPYEWGRKVTFVNDEFFIRPFSAMSLVGYCYNNTAKSLQTVSYLDTMSKIVGVSDESQFLILSNKLVHIGVANRDDVISLESYSVTPFYIADSLNKVYGTSKHYLVSYSIQQSNVDTLRVNEAPVTSNNYTLIPAYSSEIIIKQSNKPIYFQPLKSYLSGDVNNAIELCSEQNNVVDLNSNISSFLVLKGGSIGIRNYMSEKNVNIVWENEEWSSNNKID